MAHQASHKIFPFAKQKKKKQIQNSYSTFVSRCCCKTRLVLSTTSRSSPTRCSSIARSVSGLQIDKYYQYQLDKIASASASPSLLSPWPQSCEGRAPGNLEGFKNTMSVLFLCYSMFQVVHQSIRHILMSCVLLSIRNIMAMLNIEIGVPTRTRPAVLLKSGLS